MSQYPDTILLLLRNAWSEVDWILPVLHKLKALKPEWRIVAVFSAVWQEFNQNKIENLTLQAELSQIADDIVYFDQRKKSIPGLKYPEQVSVIIKDFTPDNNAPSRIEIQNAFPYAKVVAYPHGTSGVIMQKRTHPRNINEWEQSYIKNDLMIFGDQLVTKYFYPSYPATTKYSVVGIPIYDQWWGKKLIENQDFRKSQEARSAASASKVFVLFTSGINQTSNPADVTEYVLRSVAEVVFGYEGSMLFIKPHPRQDISQLTSFFDAFDSSRYMITGLHPMQLASLSDVVCILTPSSIILDALCVGKPVIEFFQHLTLNFKLVIDKNGRFYTPSRLLGLAVSANNKEEFARHIDNFFNSEDRHVWKKQQRAFRKFCPPDDNASLRAAKRILSLVDPEIAKEKGLPPIHQVSTPVTNSKRVFLTQGKKTNKYALRLELKRIKAYGMPISSVCLRELAQVFGIETFVATGTFDEHLLSTAAQIFREVHTVESAADLYQPSRMIGLRNFKNIHIHHSANILRSMLPNLRGRTLFWLSTHESAGFTFKDRTNTPIIEELRVIKEHGRKDSVILINNMRYFQPVALDMAHLIQSRTYPTVQQAMDVIMAIDRTYQFSVLGDIAIAYPSGSPVTISPAVEVCTLSRLFDNRNVDFIQVLEAENHIAFGLPEAEKKAVQALHSDYYDPYEEPGVGGHYRFWYGLTLFGEKRYAEASREFVKAIQLNCNHWRVAWFLAESAYRAGNKALAIRAVRLSSLKKPGVAGYHRFWCGLTLFSENRYGKAKQEFVKAMELKCNHWRAIWFTAESAFRSGDIALAEKAAHAVTKIVPKFKPARKLLEKMETN